MLAQGGTNRYWWREVEGRYLGRAQRRGDDPFTPHSPCSSRAGVLGDGSRGVRIGRQERRRAQGRHRQQHARADAGRASGPESGGDRSAGGRAREFSPGWDPAKDSGAQIDAMKEAWTRTRLHWERAEGPVAPMFSDLDMAIDSRYEDMLAALPAGDPGSVRRPGNDRHARDRTDPLRAGTADGRGPAKRCCRATTLAVWPTSDAQAAEFKNGLCQRLVNDTQSLLESVENQDASISRRCSPGSPVSSARRRKRSGWRRWTSKSHATRRRR